jgi:hypothetical protein
MVGPADPRALAGLPVRRWLGKLADMNAHRVAQCLCGSLKVEVEGEPTVVGVCAPLHDG